MAPAPSTPEDPVGCRTGDVQLSGGKLRVRQRPGRRPVIVFESGLGLPASLWEPVCERLPRDRALVCYDRAGLGGSEAGPRPRSGTRLAAELAELLDRLEVAPPYVLVGHSAGAFVVRLFAAARPGDVAALVLVDPSQEDATPEPLAELATNAVLRALAVLAQTRVPGALAAAVRRTAAAPAGRTAHRLRLLADLASPAQLTGVLRENQAYPDTVAQVRALRGQVDVPLRVITAAPYPGRWRRAGTGPDPAAERDAELAARSPRGRHLLARGSGHLVPFDAPQLVADTIVEVA